MTYHFQMAPQLRPHADTALSDGVAVQATYRHVLYKWQMALQSKPHADMPLGLSTQVQATRGNVHWG
jgi:hypothetical protein